MADKQRNRGGGNDEAKGGAEITVKELPEQGKKKIPVTDSEREAGIEVIEEKLNEETAKRFEEAIEMYLRERKRESLQKWREEHGKKAPTKPQTAEKQTEKETAAEEDNEKVAEKEPDPERDVGVVPKKLNQQDLDDDDIQIVAVVIHKKSVAAPQQKQIESKEKKERRNSVKIRIRPQKRVKEEKKESEKEMER